MPDTNPRSTARIAGHPLHPMIIPFPIVFFVSTLVVDLIFLNQGDPVWALAAVWLLGAGLVMSTLDVVAYAGEEFGGVKPANFLDIGGGASAEVMANGLEIVLSDPSVRSVFVNVFGGITACDAVAKGILAAFDLLAARGEAVTKPLVVRLDGNNAEEGRRILDSAANPLVERVDTMDGAARRAAELAATGV